METIIMKKYDYSNKKDIYFAPCTCTVCGVTYQKHTHVRHAKSKIHINKLNILQLQKQIEFLTIKDQL